MMAGDARFRELTAEERTNIAESLAANMATLRYRTATKPVRPHADVCKFRRGERCNCAVGVDPERLRRLADPSSEAPK